MKRTWPVLLVLLLLALPAALPAQPYTYTDNGDHTITITGYTGPGGVVSIPTTINGLTVTVIGTAFRGNTSLTGIIIPNSVTNIEGGDSLNSAFSGCINLTSATLANSVISIGSYVFSGCGQLRSITIPGNVTSIGTNVFSGCRSLTAINVSPSNSVYGNLGGALFDRRQNTLIKYPEGKAGSCIIPNSVAQIAGFSGPPGVYIEGAFQGCGKLTSVTIGSGITNIAYAGLGSCGKLTAILADAANPVYSSVSGVLFNKNRTALILYPPGKPGRYTIPNGVASIGESAFSGCSGLTSVAIPSSVTNIMDFAFFVCTSLTSVPIPNSVTSIGEGAFAACSGLRSVALPPGVTGIAPQAFSGCTSLRSVALPPGVTSIALDAFSYCSSLVSVALPPGVTDIGDYAFWDCSSLISLTVPGSVTNIGSTAFGACTALTDVCFEGNAPSDGGSIFFGDAALTDILYVSGTSGWEPAYDGIPTTPCATCSRGALKVTISPANAVSGGAQWQVDGGVPRSSGAVVLGITAGNHTLSFIAIYGWTTPSNQTVSVSANVTNTAMGVYLPTTSLLTLRTNGVGTIKRGFSSLTLQVGQGFTVTGVPGKGWVFSNWVDGAGNVLTDSAVLNFQMQSNLVLQANFVANPFVPVTGTYRGLFYDTNAVRQESSGFFTLTLSAQGGFSGNLQMGSSRLPFTGQSDAGGIAQLTVARSHTNALAGTVLLDLAPGAGHLTGTISDGHWLAELAADRAVFNSKTNPATAYAGKYTMIIPGSDDDLALPHGDGYGAVTVDAGGNVSLTGALADGTKLSTSLGQPIAAPVTRNGQWPVYAPLYQGRGSLMGWMTFAGSPEDLEGWLSWIKPASMATKFYTNGFLTLVTNVVGSRYTQPSSTRRVMNLTNGVVVFDGGGLGTPFTNTVSLTTGNQIINSSPNPLTFTLTLSSGTFNGGVTVPGTTQILKFAGALLTNQNVGTGYFLGTNLSGRVVLAPQ